MEIQNVDNIVAPIDSPRSGKKSPRAKLTILKIGDRIQENQENLEGVISINDRMGSAPERSPTQRRELTQINIEKLKKQTQAMPKEKKKHTCKFWVPRILIVLFLLAIVCLILIDNKLEKRYEMFIDWIRMNHVLGVLLVIFGLIVATILFIPGIILTVATGYALYDVYNNVLLTIFIGSIAVWLGSQIGSSIALLMGRYVFRESLETRKHKWKYFYAIDKAIEKNGRKIIFLLRLSPLTPFNIFNYLCGLTPVKIKDFLIGGIGMIPAIILFVNVGTSIKEFSDILSGDFNSGILGTVLIIAGVVISIIVVVVVMYYAKKQLKQFIHVKVEEDQEGESQEQKKDEIPEHISVNNDQQQQPEQRHNTTPRESSVAEKGQQNEDSQRKKIEFYYFCIDEIEEQKRQSIIQSQQNSQNINQIQDIEYNSNNKNINLTELNNTNQENHNAIQQEQDEGNKGSIIQKQLRKQDSSRMNSRKIVPEQSSN